MQTAGNRPRARADLSTRKVGGETVVLDRSGNHVHQFNATASFIWGLCDGDRTESEIAEALAGAYAVEREQATRDVTVLLKQFRELGLLAQSLHPGARKRGGQ